MQKKTDPEIIENRRSESERHAPPVREKTRLAQINKRLTQELKARVKAEKSLRESEAKYRELFESSLDGIAESTLDGRLIACNAAYAEMTGYTEAELKTLTYQDLTPMAWAEKDKKQVRQCFERGYSDLYEKERLRKDGSRFPVSMRIWLRKDDQGKPAGLWGIVRDISERKQAEDALRRSRMMLQRTERIANVGSWEWEIATDTVTWSEELYRIFGYDPDEAAPNWAAHPKLYHPEDMARLKRAAEAAIAFGTPYELELRALRKDGETRICLARGFAEPDADGRPVRLYGSLQDITELRRAEASLQETAQFLESIYCGVALSVFVVDVTEEGEFRYAGLNPKHEALTGIADESIKGRTPREVLPETAAATVVERYRECATSGESVTYEEWLPFKGRDTCWETTLHPLRNADGRVCRIIGTSQEITERKEMERRIRNAQKMESIGTLAGGIAHDFNNILAPILGMAELLLDDLPPGSLQHENASEILNAGKRARDLVKQILAFSRQVEHKMMPMRIQPILKEVFHLSRSTIPMDIEMTQFIQSDCGVVMADATQLHQVAMNLVTNAYHAVEATGGKIALTLTQKTLTAAELAGTVLDPGDYAILSIGDTGCGIDPTVKDKIFEPYFTTKPQGKGTGLGLAVVYGIVREHGGDIRVRSEPGKGAAFDVYLPLIKKTDPPSPSVEAEAHPGGGEHILLVDDEAAVAHYETQLLERLGYRVSQRTASLEALAAFKTNPAAFDLVMTDMAMPGMAGDQLAREIRAIRPDMPVVICTGFSERMDREKAEAMGIAGFLMKPVVKSEMARTIRAALDRTPH